MVTIERTCVLDDTEIKKAILYYLAEYIQNKQNTDKIDPDEIVRMGTKAVKLSMDVDNNLVEARIVLRGTEKIWI